MLTRLKVKGFKNLVDIDVRFGPFTCVAGGNAVGKSNLFDAISFLASLADRPFVDAALGFRDEHGRSGDIRGLFHRCGDRYAQSMQFEAEMIFPAEGIDDLGQPANATITLFSLASAVNAVTDSMAGFASLRALAAFRALEEDLRDTVSRRGWDRR